MFKKLLDEGGGEQRGLLLRGVERRKWSADSDRETNRSSRTRNSRAKFTFVERRRRATHTFFKGYRPQFTPHHGRDGIGDAGRHGTGMPGDKHSAGVELLPVAMG